MTDLVTTGSDLSALSIEQINWLLTEAGSPLVATAIVLIGTNASGEVQYEVTHYSPTIESVVKNHGFCDFDLQGDPRIQMYDVEAGDLNERADMPVDNNDGPDDVGVGSYAV
jgi:hypothetical protein